MMQCLYWMLVGVCFYGLAFVPSTMYVPWALGRVTPSPLRTRRLIGAGLFLVVAATTARSRGSSLGELDRSQRMCTNHPRRYVHA
jgi:hypothetical protein